MCSITGAMLGMNILQGVNQYRSQRAQANATIQMYNAQADAASQNAKIAGRQREQVAESYLQKQMSLDAKKRMILGQHLASAGASGLGNGGSVLDMNSSVVDEYNNDSLNLLSNQRNDTWGAWTNEANYINQANGARASAANVRAQSKMAGLATILGTATSLIGGWNTYKGAKKAMAQTALNTVSGNPMSVITSKYLKDVDPIVNYGRTAFDGTMMPFDLPRTSGTFNLKRGSWKPKPSIWDKYRR